MTTISPLAPHCFPGGGTQNQPLPHPGIVAGGCYGTHPTSWSPLAVIAPPITTIPVPPTSPITVPPITTIPVPPKLPSTTVPPITTLPVPPVPQINVPAPGPFVPTFPTPPITIQLPSPDSPIQ